MPYKYLYSLFVLYIFFCVKFLSNNLQIDFILLQHVELLEINFLLFIFRESCHSSCIIFCYIIR